ncbi:FliH/SctL family protein [Planomonospora venezuelensis]|uniref:Flagellar assembly protein FliH n=1 Tax=Planomonospora venezuelensis TaxID=1999 RepID=A0A841DFY6_PLAVE|nr:FliH/SctL family protein [Planomonospora venezuelensis]MBB5967304.1 flagellar assembly protein FliH [Planomonospora venezuelensis]GIM98609.1 hypothetical protein Pve01_02680 [Planomonospora venezuelensis]
MSSSLDAVVRGADARTFTAARFAADFGPGNNLPTEIVEEARATAQAAGYAAGWAQGREEARAEAQRIAQATARAEAERTARAEAEQTARLDSALTALAASAGQLERQTAPVATEIEELILQTAFTIAEAVLGREIAHSPEPGREALARALELAPAGRPVLVRLNPGDHATLVGAGEARFDFDGRDVALVADAGLEPGDAVAECDATSVDARLSTAVQRAKEALGL